MTRICHKASCIEPFPLRIRLRLVFWSSSRRAHDWITIRETSAINYLYNFLHRFVRVAAIEAAIIASATKAIAPEFKRCASEMILLMELEIIEKRRKGNNWEKLIIAAESIKAKCDADVAHNTIHTLASPTKESRSAAAEIPTKKEKRRSALKNSPEKHVGVQSGVMFWDFPRLEIVYQLLAECVSKLSCELPNRKRKVLLRFLKRRSSLQRCLMILIVFFFSISRTDLNDSRRLVAVDLFAARLGPRLEPTNCVTIKKNLD